MQMIVDENINRMFNFPGKLLYDNKTVGQHTCVETDESKSTFVRGLVQKFFAQPASPVRPNKMDKFSLDLIKEMVGRR